MKRGDPARISPLFVAGPSEEMFMMRLVHSA
jgi:hypothetical protein